MAFTENGGLLFNVTTAIIRSFSWTPIGAPTFTKVLKLDWEPCDALTNVTTPVAPAALAAGSQVSMVQFTLSLHKEFVVGF